MQTENWKYVCLFPVTKSLTVNPVFVCCVALRSQVAAVTSVKMKMKHPFQVGKHR